MAAKKGNNYNPKGAPKKPIDWALFESLCALQSTQSEIASCLKIHVDTLHDRVVENYKEDYSEVYKKYSESGKCSVRRNQFVLSKKNAAMAIWLGKQWLGQEDKKDANQNSAPNDAFLDTLRHLADENKSLKQSLETLKAKLDAVQP